jgi:hypothetical protein
VSSSKSKPRVGAVLSADKEKSEINFIGYGVYVGDEVPVEAVGWIADALRENKVLNPKIVLDNGTVVWGCECWWGSEENVKEMLSKFKTVISVDIEEARRKACGQ